MIGTADIKPEIWLDRHGDSLFRYAVARVRDTAVAEDMVQETLLAALQSYQRFEGGSSERTWLIGILKHKIIDYYRRVSREQQVDENDPMDAEVSALFYDHNRHWIEELGPREWGAGPLGHVERAEFRTVLQRCLSELPPRSSSAFTLREMEEMKSDEICKVLQVSATNLWVLLHRARAHLRVCLEKSWFARTDRAH